MGIFYNSNIFITKLSENVYIISLTLCIVLWQIALLVCKKLLVYTGNYHDNDHVVILFIYHYSYHRQYYSIYSLKFNIFISEILENLDTMFRIMLLDSNKCLSIQYFSTICQGSRRLSVDTIFILSNTYVMGCMQTLYISRKSLTLQRQLFLVTSFISHLLIPVSRKHFFQIFKL